MYRFGHEDAYTELSLSHNNEEMILFTLLSSGLDTLRGALRIQKQVRDGAYPGLFFRITGKDAFRSHVSMCSNAEMCQRDEAPKGVIHSRDEENQKHCPRRDTWARAAKGRECVQGTFRE